MSTDRHFRSHGRRAAFLSGRGRALTVLGLGLALAACGPRGADDDLNAEEAPGETAPMTSESGAYAMTADTIYTTDLEGSDPAAGEVEGEVAIVAGAAGSALALSIDGSGLAPGAHAWHIHQGACGTDGPVRIPLSETSDMEAITGPIDVDDMGSFRATVDVPALDRSFVGEGEHSLHIHMEPGVDHGPTVACATI